MSTDAHPLGRLAAEFAVIVVGVLVALAAQGWWENRQVDEDRARALRAIAIDLELLSEDLATSKRRVDTTTTSIRWILGSGPDIEVASDALYSLRTQYALWEIAGADVGLPTYEELQGSGRLSLLPDEIRGDLARLDDVIRSLDSIDDDNFQYQIRNLDPWLLDNAPLRSILDYDQELGREFERFAPGVLQSRRVENMLLAKLELLRNLSSSLQETHQLTMRIQGLVAARLEDAE